MHVLVADLGQLGESTTAANLKVHTDINIQGRDQLLGFHALWLGHIVDAAPVLELQHSVLLVRAGRPNRVLGDIGKARTTHAMAGVPQLLARKPWA